MMSQVRSPAVVTTPLGIVCILMVAGMLCVGLWPFHAPKNHVSWLARGGGLQFGKGGTILSSGTFKVAPVPENAPCSIEIWLQPAPFSNEGTILAFYTREAPRHFSLYQFYTGIDLQTEIQKGYPGTRNTRLYIHDIFRRGKPTFVTITSGESQTAVYIDGLLAKRDDSFPFSGQDLAGQLVIANSPRTNDTWRGVLRGLALFRQDLTPAQVLHHYETWTKDGRPDVNQNDRPVALYLLDESEGRVIHNQIPGEPDLYIPERFVVVDEYFLEPFWKEFKPSWSFCKAVLVNVVGFVPLGFMFFAYVSMGGRLRRPALATVLLGFAVSVTIEVIQAWLPTRDSGTTDIFTNTSGTALGVWLYRWVSRHDWLVKFRAYVSERCGIQV